MAEEPGGNGEGPTAPKDSMSAQTLAFPALALDEENRKEEIERAAREDMEEDMRRQQGTAARTLFHQRRGDDDTL